MDHYVESVRLLEELAAVRAELASLYADKRRIPGPAGRPARPADVAARINSLNPRVGLLMKTAAVHAQLAVAVEIALTREQLLVSPRPIAHPQRAVF